MAAGRNRLLGVGLYSVSDAARLTGAHRDTVRRWVEGYKFTLKDGEKSSSRPVVAPELDFIETTVSFADLVELLFVQAFRNAGVSLQTIRLAAVVAAEMFGEAHHPFASRRFRTDGKTILAHVGEREGDAVLVDLAKRQSVIREVFDPLLHQLDYELDVAARWWPLGRRRSVVVDPGFAFGQPTLAGTGLRVETVAATVAAWGGGRRAIRRVAEWYEVPRKAVADAVALVGDLGLAA